MMISLMTMTTIPLPSSGQARSPPALFVQLLLSAAPVHKHGEDDDDDDDDGNDGIEDDHDQEEDGNNNDNDG